MRHIQIALYLPVDLVLPKFLKPKLHKIYVNSLLQFEVYIIQIVINPATNVAETDFVRYANITAIDAADSFSASYKTS